MTDRHTSRGKAMRRRLTLAAVFACLLAGVLGPRLAFSQVAPYGEKTEGENRGDELPRVLKGVAVNQHLNQQLPMDAQFVDETGKAVRLGDYFGQKPAVLTTVYFNCPMLCSEEMDGLTSALEMVRLDPGKDFNILVISIDPTDTPAMAAKKKAFYLKRYGRPETAAGWHFLTGKEPAIDAVTKAVGFGYVRVPGPDGKLDQYAHASSIELVTAQGRMAQYYLGVEYSPKDILLGLIDASGNKIGSPVANILTYCYRYDPTTNKHSLVVARVVQLGGMVTVACLGGFMFVMFRKDIRMAREQNLTRRDGSGGTESGGKGSGGNGFNGRGSSGNGFGGNGSGNDGYNKADKG